MAWVAMLVPACFVAFLWLARMEHRRERLENEERRRRLVGRGPRL